MRPFFVLINGATRRVRIVWVLLSERLLELPDMRHGGWHRFSCEQSDAIS